MQKRFLYFGFLCHTLKLVIEVDGGVHEQVDVKLNDERRQTSLENNGLIVLRFQNDQVINKFEEVILEIDRFLLKKIDGK